MGALIGDTHGLFYDYLKIIEKYSDTIQLGDFGLGFNEMVDAVYLREIMMNPGIADHHKIIRGNHDNPARYKHHAYYLGNFGFIETYFLKKWKKVFYVSGAWSIDKAWRTEGKDWWPDEELSIPQLNKAVTLYEKVKPDVLISHDCPQGIKHEVVDPSFGIVNETRTGIALQSMIDIHRPTYCIFGHYHTSKEIKDQNTTFICLKELEVFKY